MARKTVRITVTLDDGLDKFLNWYAENEGLTKSNVINKYVRGLQKIYERENSITGQLGRSVANFSKSMIEESNKIEDEKERLILNG